MIPQISGRSLSGQQMMKRRHVSPVWVAALHGLLKLLWIAKQHDAFRSL
jgi:hypothetical protein